MVGFLEKFRPKPKTETNETSKATQNREKTRIAPSREKPATKADKQREGRVFVTIDGRETDITPSLDSGEVLVGEGDMRAEAKSVMSAGGGKSLYQLDYAKTPPELQLFHVAPKNRANDVRNPSQISERPNTYDLTPHVIDLMDKKPTDENIYVKVGGYVRLKRRVEFDKNGGIAAVIDVEHDKKGFPTSSIRRVGETMRSTVKNTFSDNGLLIEQMRTTLDESGKDQISSSRDTFTYKDMGGNIHVDRQSTEVIKDKAGQKKSHIAKEDASYSKETGYIGGNGRVDHLYA